MNKRNKRILNGCIVALAIAFVAFAVLSNIIMSSVSKTLKEGITDVSSYPEIKASWPTNLVGHFPAKAPHGAVFYYQPGFLQGGSSLQLKVTMSPIDIAGEVSRISSRILATYHGGNVNTHIKLTNGIPTTFFHTSGTSDQSFPDDYEIMVIEANDHHGGLAWNKGSTAGLAVSTQRNTIVYWAESW